MLDKFWLLFLLMGLGFCAWAWVVWKHVINVPPAEFTEWGVSSVAMPGYIAEQQQKNERMRKVLDEMSEMTDDPPRTA